MLFFICLFCICSFAHAADENVLRTEDLANRSSQEWSSDSYRRSISLYLKAAEQWTALGRFEKVSSCIRQAAYLQLILTEYDRADDLLKKAIEFDNRKNLVDEKILVTSLRALVALRSGRPKDSERYYREAVRLSNLTRSPFPIASAFYCAGEHNYSYGSADRTIELLQKALSHAELAGQKDLIAQAHLYLGFAFIRKGDPVLGLDETLAALSIRQEIGDRRGQAIALVGTGFVYSMMDDKQRALEFYESANSMFPGDVDWAEKAKALNGIATVYEEYGEPDLAEKHRRDALNLYERGNYPYGELATLPSLAKLSYLKGNVIEAKLLNERGLALASRLNDVFHIAVIKEDLGNMALDSGEYDKAIGRYREAATIYDKLKIRLPRVQGLLAKAHEKKGELGEARRYYMSSLAANREIRDRFAEGQSLYDLARLDRIENKEESALKLAGESVEISDALSSNVLNSRLKSTYFSSIYERYELYIELLIKSGRRLGDGSYSSRALQASERARARSMLETLMLSKPSIIRDADPEMIEREDEIRATLNMKADMLTDALSSAAGPREIDDLAVEIETLSNNLEEIKARLKKNSPIYSALKDPSPFDIATFQRDVLDDDTVLMEFFFGKDEGYLWLVDKNKIESYVLPTRKQIDSRVEKLMELLGLGRQKGPENSNQIPSLEEIESEYAQEASRLSDDLFAQLGNKLAGKRLIIVPDGKLRLFPISSLPWPGNNEPILISSETIYEPSASTLFLLINQRKRTAENDLLVFSDPVFSDLDSRLSGETSRDDRSDTAPAPANSLRFAESMGSLPRLLASKTEGDAIATILGTSNSKVFTGFAANRDQALSPDISNYRIIHFATHSIVNHQHPELSGIVLSRFKPGGEQLNQFVRLQDIYAMNLSADLVVLSACDTGIGKDVRGEGLMSFTNGFIQAGAGSTVSTFWKIDDEATLQLMKDFYSGLASENLPPSQALRNAQLKMSRSQIYRSPFYWAAFNFQGDFRRTPSLSTGRQKDLYPFMISVFVLSAFFLIYRYLKRRKGKAEVT